MTSASPVIKVEKGTATAEELAGLVAALLAYRSGGTAGAPGAGPGGPAGAPAARTGRARWSRPDRTPRLPGPRSWRA